MDKVLEVWGGKGLEKLKIVPAHVVNALICLAIAIYVLRSARHWLEKNFLPKTMMEPGIRSSLVILLTLSTLGIQWNNLAWIVSALSVGIGFGLQEIVKNFISGLILLTFPLDIDPEKVRTLLLLEAYREHEPVQSASAPSVTFSQLTPSGIVLSVTGFVSSPGVVASTKSDLLFEILKRLRADGITLSMPQKMIVENANLSSTTPPES